MRWYRKRNWDPWPSERFIPRTKQRIDLFHMIDILAQQRGTGELVGVQVTSLKHLADHVEKLLVCEYALDWCRQRRLEVHGWYQGGRDGRRWLVRRVLIKRWKPDSNALVATEITE